MTPSVNEVPQVPVNLKQDILLCRRYSPGNSKVKNGILDKMLQPKIIGKLSKTKLMQHLKLYKGKRLRTMPLKQEQSVINQI